MGTVSELKTYRHEHTGKVGQFSDAVARIFPQLKLVVAEAAEPTAESAPQRDRRSAKNKEEVAV